MAWLFLRMSGGAVVVSIKPPCKPVGFIEILATWAFTRAGQTSKLLASRPDVRIRSKSCGPMERVLS